MGAILAVIVCIVGAGIFLGLGHYLCLDCDKELLGIPCLVVGILFIIVGVIFTMNFFYWLFATLNLEASITANLETRKMYIDQLVAYEANRSNDVTASETYLNLYKEIISFNKEANKAANGSWWG